MSIIAVLEGSSFCAGMAMGTASILSVGPNNITLIREGLIRGRTGMVSSMVWASYLVLLTLALVMTDKIAAEGSFVRPALSWLGFLTLCWFAFLALRSYYTKKNDLKVDFARREAPGECARRILTLIWLNPLTYVELLFLPATMGASFVLPACRYLFISGLIIMATTACFGYTFGGRLCAPLFGRKEMLRTFDLISGIILCSLACIMAIGLALRPA